MPAWLAGCSNLPGPGEPRPALPEQSVPSAGASLHRDAPVPPPAAPPAVEAAPAAAAPPPFAETQQKITAAPPQRKPDATLRLAGSAQIPDAAAERTLAAIAQRWQQDKSRWVILRAHPAAGGSREYAQARALQDSREVAARLIRLGVSQNRIRALSYGRTFGGALPHQVDVFFDPIGSD